MPSPAPCPASTLRPALLEPDWGQPHPDAGEFARVSLEAAVKDLASTKVDVLVTAPINKDTIQSGQFKFPGHTEYLADKAGVEGRAHDPRFRQLARRRGDRPCGPQGCGLEPCPRSAS